MKLHRLAILVFAPSAFIACASTPGARPLDMSVGAHEQAADVRAEAVASQARQYHPAASQALRDAEVRACSGLSDDDRNISPFDHRRDIESVRPALGEKLWDERGTPPEPVGAVVTFRAVPGVTAEWLQRVVDCHIARNDALGNDLPEMPSCPLVPKGITATVSSSGDGFAVRIESQDASTAREVLRRAEMLTNHG